MEEVWKCATAINAAKDIDDFDVETLREVMPWVRPAVVARQVDVATELCTWEACRTAIRRGYKKGKGLGIDGFDGYLMRIAPARIQRRYWRV